ncbi:MAG: hypothetical protein KBD53_07490 [Candidatus Omnitrophica bacterium]|nr:hypothetical protein [Candidatus Omnitrophota bacterium]
MKQLKLIFSLGILFLACGCSQTKVIAPDIVEKPRLNRESFFGERVVLDGTKSVFLTELDLELNFPTGHELLAHANPNITFYASSGEQILKQELYPDTHHYVINQKMDAPIYYIVLGIYYCHTGSEGQCMMQNVLYEVHTSEQLIPGPLRIEYDVPVSNF